MNRRHKLITYHGNNLATFECPDGHRAKRVVIPLKGRRQAPSETGIRLIVSWWSKTGATMKCRHCERKP